MTERTHRARGLAARSTLVCAGAVWLAAGCGAAQKAPESAPQETAPAPAEESSSESMQPGYGAPAGAAPPAPQAGYPDTTRSEDAAPEREAGPSGDELARLTRDLDAALTLAAPDCPQAAFLRDQICDLAERVCDLASDHRADPELGQRCGAARSSCERATARVSRACP